VKNNLRTLIKFLIKEYWGEPVDGAKQYLQHADSLNSATHFERAPMDVAPPPDKWNKDKFGDEIEQIERMTVDDWIELMGLEDRDIPGKRYK